MNIAFDAVAILGPDSKNRGIGNYSLSQFTSMIEADKKNHYYFFNLMEFDYHLDEFIGNTDNLTCVNYFCGKDNFLIRDSQFAGIIGNLIRKFIQEYKIDIFCVTSPFDMKMMCYEKEWFTGVKVVAIVYDIIPYIMKREYFTGSYADRNFSMYMKRMDMLRWMDQLLVISESVKNDMVNYLSFPESDITVIYGAVDEIYEEINITEQQKRNIEEKYAIDSPFIICTGGNDFRKNIDGLIVAYSKIKEELIRNYQLVIVCKLSDKAVIRFENLIEQLQIKGRVILTNFVETEELLQLYNLATLLAFPSKYEGFGLPVVEAWACGTPVLTSNNSSLGEISTGAAVLVDPYDTLDIKRGLEQALLDTDLNALLQKGKERLEEFRWKKVVERSIDILNRLDTCKEQNVGDVTENFVIVAPAYESNDAVKMLTDQIKKELEECKKNSTLVISGLSVELLQEKQIVYVVGKDSESLSCYGFIAACPGMIAIAMDDFYDFKQRNIEGKTEAEVELARLVDTHCEFVITDNEAVQQTVLRNNISIKVLKNINEIFSLSAGAISNNMLYKIGLNEVKNKKYTVKETRELARTLAFGK